MIQDPLIRLVTGEGEERSPVRRALVYVSGPAFGFLLSDDDGSFTFDDLPPGTYHASARDRELVSMPALITVPPKDAAGPLELRLVPGGRLLLRFRDPDRPALAGILLRLLDEVGEEYTLDVQPSGSWDRVTGVLCPGAYRLEVTIPGRKMRTIPVTIEAGADTTLVVGLP
ncbi:MAG: hypothetical protein ACYS99_16855 [Planctomycetota bacterium]|jgi:hypothetical protein